MKIASPAVSSAAFPFAGDAKAQAGDPDEAEGPPSVWKRESRWRQAQHKRADQIQRQTRCQREQRLRELGRNRID